MIISLSLIKNKYYKCLCKVTGQVKTKFNKKCVSSCIVRNPVLLACRQSQKSQKRFTHMHSSQLKLLSCTLECVIVDMIINNPAASSDRRGGFVSMREIEVRYPIATN